MLQITKGLVNTPYKVLLRTLAGAIAMPLTIIPALPGEPEAYSLDIPTTLSLAPGKYRAFYYRTVGTESEYLGFEKVQWDGTNVVIELASTQGLAEIKENAAIARMAQNNAVDTDLATAITTAKDDNGNPLYRLRTRNAAGQASVEDVVSRERVPL